MSDTPHATTDHTRLHNELVQRITAAGGWIGFDEFMHRALYTPQVGYYARDTRKFGQMPRSGSDFVTAPELSALFGQTIARQVAQALHISGCDEIWEFGAGSGALAAQVLNALDALQQPVRRYTIVDVSSSLRARQQDTLRAFGDRVHWAQELPEHMQGVILGNEVLDAMPVQLLVRKQGVWHERGVGVHTATPAASSPQTFIWSDHLTHLRPPLEIDGEHDYLCEIHPQAQAFVSTLGHRLQRGVILLIDYGFGEREYYHPQRHMGTLMCHQAHKADSDPLTAVGDKDITTHINFTGIALSAQDAGLEVLGYTSQGRFLLNCGITELMSTQTLAQRTHATKLIHEHEMGELFKVLALGRGLSAQADGLLGFAQGDRTHQL